MYIGDTLAVDAWKRKKEENAYGNIDLKAGQRYPMRIETRHDTGGAGKPVLNSEFIFTHL